MRRYRSEEEWRALFEEQKGGGKSAKQFCLSKGISANVFYRKQKELAGPSEFVRLAGGGANGTPIEIAVGGVRIEVTDGFAEEALVRVLRCVREALDA